MLTHDINPCRTCGLPGRMFLSFDDTRYYGYRVACGTPGCYVACHGNQPAAVSEWNEKNPIPPTEEPECACRSPEEHNDHMERESKTAKETMPDPIDHPSHYTSLGATCSCGKPIECIDVTEHMGFRIGNATKYLWRCGSKGNALEDLKKARWYIDREIAAMEKEAKS